MKRLIANLVLIGGLLFLLQSCIKVDHTTYTYTLKGRIMSSNTHQPVAGLQLILYAPPYGLNSNREEIGNTYTDTNGNFVMGNISTKHNRNLEFLGEFIPVFSLSQKPKHGDTVDRGDIYINE